MVGRQAVWGQHSVVDALRALLSAALEDPSNQRFQVLGDGILPLYPPPAVYLTLMRQMRSHINACRPAALVRCLLPKLSQCPRCSPCLGRQITGTSVAVHTLPPSLHRR